MNIENISNEEKSNTGSDLVCRIELTVKETEAILHSLGRTMCKGEQLTVSMELEDKLVDVLMNYR